MALRDSGKGKGDKGLTMTRGFFWFVVLPGLLTLPRTRGPSLLEVNLIGVNGNIY